METLSKVRDSVKNKKQSHKNEIALLLKKLIVVFDYRSLSTDFTSLSSFLMYIFANTKQTIEINGNIGSIPFSGKLIPPDKFSSQNISNAINKAFIPMLILFSSSCLFLFLNEKTLYPQRGINNIEDNLTKRLVPKKIVSSEVRNKKKLPKMDNSMNIVCILCIIIIRQN